MYILAVCINSLSPLPSPVDFGPLSLTLSFTAGSSSGDSVCEDITIFDDNVFEPDIEDFTVSLSSGDSAVDITNVNSAVIILDNDGACTTQSATLSLFGNKRFYSSSYSFSETCFSSLLSLSLALSLSLSLSLAPPVLIIGFESTAYTYSESAGTATVCAAILPPVLPQDNVMVIVTYETQESSAIGEYTCMCIF